MKLRVTNCGPQCGKPLAVDLRLVRGQSSRAAAVVGPLHPVQVWCFGLQRRKERNVATHGTDDHRHGLAGAISSPMG